jgi:AAA family ATP:ADP antiporter
VFCSSFLPTNRLTGDIWSGAIMMAPTMTSTTDLAPTSILQRLFGIQRNEVTAVAWSFLYFFCVLSAYYILRPVRETMGVGSGTTTLPYLFMASFAVMLLATPVFGWIASRFPRKVFLPWVYGFFIVNILLFWAVFVQRIDDGLDHVWLGRTFFVWLSVFNLYVVSVYWSFMADIYTREQGRRLFGLLSSGGSIGALLGGVATVPDLRIVVIAGGSVPAPAQALGHAGERHADEQRGR